MGLKRPQAYGGKSEGAAAMVVVTDDGIPPLRPHWWG